VDSGSASDPIALTAGTPQTITVVASEAGKSAKTYTLTVTENSSLAIGQSYGGGVVAYIADPGDPASEQSGLIVATADQSAGIQWATETYWHISVPEPGAIGTAIGTGLANTTAIIAQNSSGSTYAAGLARAYNGGGFTDWYLPSKNELDQLRENRTAIGGFTAGWYWSSSEANADFVWFEDFNDGGQGSVNKSVTFGVRPVRSFSGVSSKAIIAFSFEGLIPAAPGIVNEGGHSISVAVPYGTDVNALVATFTTTGASVKVGGTTQTRGFTRGVQILDHARPDHDREHCWRLTGHA